MLLPGKLCIGILEEDNPLRSYFRFKPLLIDDNGRYVPCREENLYPDEGCIRIVPDKNESYHFKTRMRQIGLFCVVDLREHPNENDKIRPNKNYRPDGEENNACIIYSDVVRSPMADMIFEILPDEAQIKPIPEPATQSVLIREGDGLNPMLYKWESIVGSDGMARLVPVDAQSPVADLQVFEMPGFRGRAVAFGIKPASVMDRVCDEPEKAVHAEVRSPIVVKPAPAVPDPEVKSPVQAQPEAEQASAPQSEPQPEPKAEVEPKPLRPEEVGRDVERPHVRKPWIHHDETFAPQPINPRLSRAEQLMAAQAGLNPRRGRSLQELIDEKWQRSRLNQLGQPVAPIATGAPVQNPVENAIMALRNTWIQPQLRKPLLEGLAGLEDFHQSMRVMYETAKSTAIDKQLNALEAQRLELMAELDRLRAGNQTLREQLKQEIRRDEAESFKDAVQKTEAARAEQAKYTALAEEARAAAQDAQDMLDVLTGERLERTIREIALTRRVAERMDVLRDSTEAVVPPAVEKIDFNAFMDRVKRRFEAEGWCLSNVELANLCVSFVVSPVMLLSGAPGSGKSTAARMLMDALGWTGAKRVAICAPDMRLLEKDPRVAALKRVDTAPAALILDDANLVGTPDLFRGMAQTLPEGWRIVVTLQDRHSGAPVNAGMLDKGFLVRLTPPSTQTWMPAVRAPKAEETFASMADIASTLPQIEMPTAFTARMNMLLTALKDDVSLSRRAMDDAWRYCAAMVAILGEAVESNVIWDLVLAQRILPPLIGCAPIRTVMRLRDMTANLPVCAKLFEQQVPIMV